jgi:hypothetical protein
MGMVRVQGVKECIVCDHVLAHVIGLFKDFRPNVHKKGIRQPPAKDHYLVNWVVVEEEHHYTARTEGVGPDVGWAEAKGFLSAAKAACVSDLV